MNRSSSVLQSARREATFAATLWVATCLYTVGYAALFAYRQEPVPQLLFGMPQWVVWGVMAPWTVCTVVTCWFALYGMRDEELDDDPSADGEPTPMDGDGGAA